MHPRLSPRRAVRRSSDETVRPRSRDDMIPDPVVNYSQCQLYYITAFQTVPGLKISSVDCQPAPPAPPRLRPRLRTGSGGTSA